MLEINDENQLQISKVAKLKLNNSVKAQETICLLDVDEYTSAIYALEEIRNSVVAEQKYLPI